MASEKPSKAKKQKTAPTTVAEFTILPLTLPALPGLPDAYADAKHYLYVKQHEPKHSTPGHDRSLFIANVPIDASETGIRALFAEQLGGSRVERVEFDSAIPALTAHKRFQDASDAKAEGKEKRGKKRKRDADVVAEGVVEDEESALPRIWSSELRKGGSGAVVVFVDRKSMRGALKEVQRAVKEGREIVWKGGEGLGVERESSTLCIFRIFSGSRECNLDICMLTQAHRLQIPPHPPLPPTRRPPNQRKRLPHAIHRPRKQAQQNPQARAIRTRRRRLHHRRARRRTQCAARGRGEEEGGVGGAEEEEWDQGRLL